MCEHEGNPQWYQGNRDAPRAVTSKPPVTAQTVVFRGLSGIDSRQRLDTLTIAEVNRGWELWKANNEQYARPALPEEIRLPEDAAAFFADTLSPNRCGLLWDNSMGMLVFHVRPDYCCVAGIRLLLASGSRAFASTAPAGVVSASVFRMPHAYRASSKYAQGLVRLADAVGRQLPAFELRVFRDASVTPTVIGTEESPGDRISPQSRDPASRAVRDWASAWATLRELPHVSIIDYDAPPFARHDAGRRRVGHTDAFGTFVRFLPLFASPPGCPSWAASPPHNAVAFVCDADHAGSAFDRLIVDTVAWFARSTVASGEPVPDTLVASSAPPQLAFSCSSVATLASASSASEPARKPTVDLCTFSFSASVERRHEPFTALPPLFAGALATRTRWPIAWLRAFLQDAARCAAPLPAAAAASGSNLARLGKSRVAGAFAAKVHSPAARNHTYERRNVASTPGPFVFGLDEAFLSRVVVPRVVVGGVSASRTSQHWLFLTCPPVDRVISKCLRSIPPEAGEAGSQRQGPHTRRMLKAAASAAGMGEALPLTGDIDAKSALATFPGAAVTRVGLWDRAMHDGGALVKAGDEAVSGGVRGALQGMLGEWVMAMCAGELECDPDAIAYATQALSRLAGAEETSSGVLSVQSLVLRPGGLPEPAAMLGDVSAPSVAAALLREVCGVGRRTAESPAPGFAAKRAKPA